MKNLLLIIILSFSFQTFSQENKTYKIGDFTFGGIIFWLDESGQHGLVCAKSDYSELVMWDTKFKTVNEGFKSSTPEKPIVLALGDGPYSGKLNTAIIVAALGFGDGRVYAAAACNELQVTENEITYGDWYLPSREELNMMYKNRKIIDKVALENGGKIFHQKGVNGLRGNSYWSSTEDYKRNNDIAIPSHSAWIHNFKKGGQSFQISARKYMECSVRAIRSF
ncbi:MAG: DUF1566 domain-containing protein [Flavobacteriales bacterium]|nr:DUF1566 domain-containing protein [Flavobacteriales bacterium]